jgi:hypothetical protein
VASRRAAWLTAQRSTSSYDDGDRPLAAAGMAIASTQADIGFDPNRIVLPCDVQMFGGQIDINYAGAGPTVFPKFTATFFDGQNNLIVSSGYLKTQALTSVIGTLAPMTAGSVQTDGLTPVSSTSQFCAWLFQPSDLPADKVVRMHAQLTAYPDDTYHGNVVGDPNPANNGHDIYVRRSCSCQ